MRILLLNVIVIVRERLAPFILVINSECVRVALLLEGLLVAFIL